MTPHHTGHTPPTATRRKPPIRRPRPVPERTLLYTLADALAARPELARDPRPRATPTREDHPMSTADHATCCCAETLADIERLTQERDDARGTACRLEAELACPGYITELDVMPDPAPIIEWAASVGLDAKDIPADGVRIIGRTPLGGCLLLAQSFEVTPDGKRVILADGSGFARTAPRHFEVTTLPPEPWLTEWSAPPAERSAAQMPEAVPREGQEGAGSAPSRVADGLEGLDWHLCDMTDQCASSPTAAAEARDIVRSGLRDVLDWLGEGDSPGPDAEMAGGDDDAEWTESLDELRAERDRFLDLAEQAGWTIRKFLEQRDEARAAAKKLRDALDRERAKVERVREIAEGWRYKGEFGWGSWQIGEGPDPDGYVLDHAAGKIRAALSADQPDDDAEWDAREAIVRARGGR